MYSIYKPVYGLRIVVSANVTIYFLLAPKSKHSKQLKRTPLDSIIDFIIRINYLLWLTINKTAE